MNCDLGVGAQIARETDRWFTSPYLHQWWKPATR